MKSLTILIAILFSIATLYSQPSTITYQGKLLDNSNIPVNQSNVVMTFAIYDASSGGFQIWPSSGVVSKTVNINLGLYSVTLGTGVGNDDIFTSTNLNANNLYLEVSIGGTPLPRTQLTTVPYSILSNSAQNVVSNNGINIQTLSNNHNINLQPNGTGKVVINNGLQFNVGTSLNGKVLTSDANGDASWQDPQSALGGNAGGALSGTYPNPSLADTSVTTSKLANNSVNTSKIIDGTIINADISPTAAISYSKLYLTNQIQNSDIVPNAITTSKVANGTVTTSKLADSAVSGLKLLTYAVNNRHLQNNSVSGDKIALGSDALGDLMYYDGNNYVRLPIGNDGEQLTILNNVPTWSVNSSTVNHNTTLSGNGTSGSPLSINLSNPNTWTSNQTFASSFLITSNSRIAMTNSDNNARDIRLQEPSGSGSQYVGFRCPTVVNNGNYLLPSAVGGVGYVLTIASTNNVDSASLAWVDPGASDIRLKKDISKIKYGLKEVLKLNPVNYTMKSDEGKHIGFIAQEVKEIIPEVVTGIEGDLDKNQTLGISYGHLTALLVKAIQEQNSEIQELKNNIDKLKQELATSQTINTTMMEKLVKLTTHLDKIMNQIPNYREIKN